MSEQRQPSADILSLPYPALQAQLAIWGEPSFRAKQLWQWLYVHLAADFGEMTNLPQALRERLAQFYRLSPLTPIDELVSEDRLTRKVLLRGSRGPCRSGRVPRNPRGVESQPSPGRRSC